MAASKGAGAVPGAQLQQGQGEARGQEEVSEGAREGGGEASEGEKRQLRAGELKKHHPLSMLDQTLSQCAVMILSVLLPGSIKKKFLCTKLSLMC